VLRANLLAVGSDEALARLLDSLLPHLRQPLYRWAPGQCLHLPAPGVLGTLIIEDVGALPLDDQRRLFDWLTVTLGNTRIVSTTAVGLLPLVETGAFIDSLYYRLNVVCIEVTAPSCGLDVEYVLNITVRSLSNVRPPNPVRIHSP
jgi:Sigma-54 interaction domain